MVTSDALEGWPRERRGWQLNFLQGIVALFRPR
jgi:hypothetical protein